MNPLVKFIKKHASISQETITELEKVCIYEQVDKDQEILTKGNICRYIYFLEKGVTRTHHIHNGKDVTSWLYPENHLFTSWYSFITQTATQETIQIVEDAELVKISYTHYQKLLAEHRDFERFGRLFYEDQLSFLDEFYKGYMFLSAKEKYDLLLQYFPDVTLRVNLGYIASLLGISQETLSRVRSIK